MSMMIMAMILKKIYPMIQRITTETNKLKIRKYININLKNSLQEQHKLKQILQINQPITGTIPEQDQNNKVFIKAVQRPIFLFNEQILVFKKDLQTTKMIKRNSHHKF